MSIITVTRNNREGLEATFRSLASQKGGDFEWVVIDGASTDQSVDFLESLAFAPLRWVSEPDRGIYDAMNKGLSYSRGNWVQFLNAGDCFFDAENAVSTIVAATRAATKSILKFGYEYQGVVRYEEVSIKRLYREMPNHQSFVYSASVFSEVRYETGFRFAADYAHFLQVEGWAKTQRFDTPLIRYEGGGVAESRKNLSKIWQERAVSIWRCSKLGYHKWPMFVLAALMACLRRFYYL